MIVLISLKLYSIVFNVFSKLICQVEYDRKHSFETIFSYRVPKPLDLKTKFYNTVVSTVPYISNIFKISINYSNIS